jgi:hypothetical protein
LLAAQLDALDERMLAAGVGLVTLISGNLAIGVGVGAAVLIIRAGLRRLPAAGGLVREAK